MRKEEAITKKLIRNIKSVKIQGAEKISIASVSVLKEIVKLNREKDNKKLFSKILDFSCKIAKVRPTEPCLKNSLQYIIKKNENLLNIEHHKFVENILKSCDYVENHFKESKKKINEFVYRKIPEGSIIFTHCHSSTVVDALIYAFKRGKYFEVHNTETRPLYQGRITATELSKAGIKVTHFVDAAARLALKKVDIMFIGSDSITSEGKVINKIGSEMFAEVAHNYDVPVYSCTDSWKFDINSVFAFESKIEKRFAEEVWPNKPKNVRISNFAFEKVNPENITGIISELGIIRPTIFLEEFRRNYPIFCKK